jgi:hypothetical protein
VIDECLHQEVVGDDAAVEHLVVLLRGEDILAKPTR